jgi:ABC-2 type transport system ATP-binding protein
MLEIKNLYKEHKNSILNHMDLTVAAGNTVTIECSSEASDMLINLIIGKEIPAKGEIYIDSRPSTEYIKSGLKHVGIIFRNEGFYERSTVKDYLKFYSEVLNSSVDYMEIMKKLALLDIGGVKIRELSYSQRRRLSFARERLKDLRLLIFQEPLLNMDRDGTRIILENLEELRAKGVAVLNTSVSFKDTIQIGGQAYVLEETGLQQVQQDNEAEASNSEDSGGKAEGTAVEEKNEIDTDKNEDPPAYKIEKIPAKLEERILLFNPIEIDYIESEQGISNLNVRGEKFTCMLSLNELENRLKYFGFFRCHRSYLVNLQRVREIITWTRNSYSLILDDKNKSSIPLSKGRMDELKDILKL